MARDTSHRADRLLLLRLAAIAALLAPGCGDHKTVKPDYRSVSMLPPGTKWTGDIMLVGDSQKFHIGNKAFLFRSGFTDRSFSSSAVRVPQQDLFGDSLLALVPRKKKPTVHLGDAMDLSCADEWRAFVQVMNDGASPAWFWTPGNHDGYFFGNFVGPEQQWRAACDPEEPMTKGAALRAYVTTHLAAYAGVALDPAQGSWTCPPDASCHGLLRATWKIYDGKAYHRSYLVQEIDLDRSQDAQGRPDSPPASLLLIDTASYDRPPRIAPTEAKLHYAAGKAGHIGAEQLAVIDQWTARAVGEGRTVVLGGHHPFYKLDEESRAGINQLIGSKRAATYISADTHWGQYYTHIDAGDYSWLEPNLGSIIDYDAEYAELSIGFQGTSKFVKVARTTVGAIMSPSAPKRGELGIGCGNPEWLARPGDDDFYTRYMTTTTPEPAAVEILYYSTMLAALDRYWRCVPTTATADPMPTDCIPKVVSCNAGSEVHDSIAETLASHDLNRIRGKAVELVERDRSRNAEPCLRREYKVCQSLWAAEFEHRQYITPVKGNDVFEINTGHTTNGAAAEPRRSP